MIECTTLVVYDISDDRLRKRVADRCLDYGLRRLQHSAFCGPLSSTKREELYYRLADLSEEADDRSQEPVDVRIIVVPMCRRDVDEARYLSLGAYETAEEIDGSDENDTEEDEAGNADG